MTLSNEKKIEEIEKNFRNILEILGLDLTDPSLSKTPKRVAKMYVEEVFSGLNPENFPTIITEKAPYAQGEMILVKNISFVTFCEHHLVPVWGHAKVAYICQETIIGLSNINRLVRYFAKRPQMQERLTAQIAEALAQILNHQDIAISLEAKHYCVMARDVEDHESELHTNKFMGAFEKQPYLRKEFLVS